MGGAPRSDVSPIETDLAERLPGRVIHSAFRLQGEPLNAQAPPPLGRPPPPPGMIVLFDRNASPDLGTGMVKGRPAATFISVALTDGTWLNIMAQADPHHEGRWHVGFLGPLLGGLVVVIVLSVLAVRRASQPLSLLAAAADRLGRDVGAPPVAVEGPLEVRAAAMAFNRMQFRLRRFVEDRTQMIAAISHDLRTPLTRMRLRAEFVEDDEARFKMLDDLDEMESMIAETLAFARDDAAREAREPVDLASMLRDLCEQFETRFAGPERAVISAGPTGVKRAFANLLENARKYADSAQMTMSVDESRVTVVLDDDGPGLPEAELERVFAPFYRLETSRNRETGGTGLGLAVARSAVRAHGGDIALANRAEGGLSVTVTLPA
jgi:signal transduction histidine kinase